ncbi:hypothetical protein PHLCEN_2v13675 [Hermanssonia centrifuga]|uniref:BTB domain-containing protein n=1 Tax=Hermanssonia centrifuga TaxID=98765 RepID=A0A2R6NDJ5_9APHY|nr:hypothetical protein PHLCEN_2v13675 [Hermanssonia centrifuga]
MSEYEIYTVAPAPFDRPTAEVILRTSDDVDFYVYKAVLILSSTFFETMFSLHQPSLDDSIIHLRNGLAYPVIAVSEDSQTLEHLLRFCYPVRHPKITDLQQLDLVLEAALKYEVAVAIELLREGLHSFVHRHPLHIFAIACRHKLEPEAKLAAVQWGKGSFDDDSLDFGKTVAGASYVLEMARISAGAYHRLLSYVRTHAEISFCSWPAKPGHWHNERTPPFNQTGVDTIIRSSDNIDFRVHKVLLVLAGGESLLSQDNQEVATDGLPVFRIDAVSEVAEELLRMCYPPVISGSRFESGSFYIFKDVVYTANTYGMSAVIQAMKSVWKNAMEKSPLSMYLIAVACKWTTESLDAFQFLACAPIHELYAMELEKTTADVYHRLLKQHHHCQVIIHEVMTPYATAAEYPRTDVSNGSWRKEWAKTVDGRSTRTIPSILLTLEVERRRNGRDPRSLVDLIRRSQQMEKQVKEALSKAIVLLSHLLFEPEAIRNIFLPLLLGTQRSDLASPSEFTLTPGAVSARN